MNNRAKANEALRRELKRKISGTRNASSTRPQVTGDRRPPTFADDYDRRMSNWRRWRLFGNTPGSGSSPAIYQALATGIYNRTDPRRREATMPMIDGEAADTDQAVRSLAAAQRQAIEVFYLQSGGMDRKARACGCRRDTFKDRLQAARVAILAELTRRRTSFAASHARAARAS